MIRRIFAVFLIAYIIPLSLYAKEPSQNQIIQQAKKGIISINNKLITSLYAAGSNKEIVGTGFLANKSKGIIVTNEHLASNKRIGEYKVSFFNGRETEAKLLYTDPTLDFAFLKVNPSDIPNEVVALELSISKVEPEETVTIIGNNQGNNYSIQTGIVSNLYECWGIFPSQNMTISLNTRGGSSGSPILNKKGKVVGLNYAGDATYAAAIPIAYIKDALEYILQEKTPPRKDIGAMFTYYSLDKAATFAKFPKQLIDKYTQTYPNSFSKALKVTMVLEGTPAFGILKPGDIIWEVDNEDIGPKLYKYQKMLNKAHNDSVEVTVYRDGKLHNFEIPVYDLQKRQLSKAVIFGGATFIEVDNFLNLISGAPVGKVFVTNVTLGSSLDVLPWTSVSDFGTFYLINVVSINNTKINNLDDLIKVIPSLVEAKNFRLAYKDYAFNQGFDSIPFTHRNDSEVDIQYNSPDSEPTIMRYDNKKHEWVSEKIKLSKHN